MVWLTSPQQSAQFDLVLLDFSMGETNPDTAVTATISGRITGSIVWSV
jgi:hypothetical protein